MTRSAALVIVNYRSAPFAIDAIRTARAACSSMLHIVVVDNSLDAAEADALRPYADAVIISERNAGYAAAINRARREIDADVMIVANPDVVFGRDSVDALLAVDAAVAGPALFWDDRHEWLLPPAELQTGRQVFGRALGTRAEGWARARDQRRIAKRIAFWELKDTVEVSALSGAVMAISTRAFDRAGGFDERFALYFEENDFLRRVDGPIMYVPDAKCRHLYNQSAADSAEARASYAQSERAYLQKWNGPFAATFLKKLERPRRVLPMISIGDEPITVPDDTVIEASPQPSFETAAGHFPHRSYVTVPSSIWDTYRSATLYLRVVDRATRRVLATYSRSKMRV